LAFLAGVFGGVKGVLSISSIDWLALTAFVTFAGGGPASSSLEAGSSRGNFRRQADAGGSKAPLTVAPTFEEGPGWALEESSSLNSKSSHLDKIGGKKP